MWGPVLIMGWNLFCDFQSPIGWAREAKFTLELMMATLGVCSKTVMKRNHLLLGFCLACSNFSGGSLRIKETHIITVTMTTTIIVTFGMWNPKRRANKVQTFKMFILNSVLLLTQKL